ncbi:hypothetical protein SAMN02745247_01202 [Butyrivibrio hungatei DSM 14810]|uniref:Uncharacterized protein n=1 Tax=Butyrivibrio hungatei DSM 14810 TaxID=1121132 RepID=A0A1M7S757_9FIRM|nr:hypothetical protein [Butyrivibrio hungatei]SHN54296.1 hypothetical protein SAMN02745247_01202 [Butyrivibrio hungatei DSM 14810]
MQMLVVAIVLSICGLLSSFILIGIFPSIISFCLSIYCLSKEKTINTVRALLMSLVGILVPIIMYLNTFGLHLPYDKGEGYGTFKQILYDNYSNFGFDMSFMVKDYKTIDEQVAATAATSDDGIYYVSDGVVQEEAGYNEIVTTEADSSESSLDNSKYPESIFESFEDIEKEYETTAKSTEIGASDDDMPSYGGLPVGTLIVAQYFREDDHNCNPVLVLQNKTGNLCRYECMFTARDKDGNEIATSERTSEVVPDGAKFVIEGRFDKSELGGTLPSMYEFTISKRTPYEKDVTQDVYVYTKIDGNSVILAAENPTSLKVKVDAYVLFFDGDELVDCIWLIPSNRDEVCITPGSVATIKGDAYYRFDRIETYYTAYEAVETR